MKAPHDYVPKYCSRKYNHELPSGVFLLDGQTVSRVAVLSGNNYTVPVADSRNKDRRTDRKPFLLSERDRTNLVNSSSTKLESTISSAALNSFASSSCVDNLFPREHSSAAAKLKKEYVTPREARAQRLFRADDICNRLTYDPTLFDSPLKEVQKEREAIAANSALLAMDRLEATNRSIVSRQGTNGAFSPPRPSSTRKDHSSASTDTTKSAAASRFSPLKYEVEEIEAKKEREWHNNMYRHVYHDDNFKRIYEFADDKVLQLNERLLYPSSRNFKSLEKSLNSIVVAPRLRSKQQKRYKTR